MWWGISQSSTQLVINDFTAVPRGSDRGVVPNRLIALDSTEQPVLTWTEHKQLEQLRTQDQQEIKPNKKELRRKEKAMADMAALLSSNKSGRPSARRTWKADKRRLLAQVIRADQRGSCVW